MDYVLGELGTDISEFQSLLGDLKRTRKRIIQEERHNSSSGFPGMSPRVAAKKQATSAWARSTADRNTFKINSIGASSGDGPAADTHKAALAVRVRAPGRGAGGREDAQVREMRLTPRPPLLKVPINTQASRVSWRVSSDW